MPMRSFRVVPDTGAGLAVSAPPGCPAGNSTPRLPYGPPDANPLSDG